MKRLLFCVFMLAFIFMWACKRNKIPKFPPGITQLQLVERVKTGDETERLYYKWEKVPGAVRYLLELSVNGRSADVTTAPATRNVAFFDIEKLQENDELNAAITPLFQTVLRDTISNTTSAKDVITPCEPPKNLISNVLSDSSGQGGAIEFTWDNSQHVMGYLFHLIVNDSVIFNEKKFPVEKENRIVVPVDNIKDLDIDASINSECPGSLLRVASPRESFEVNFIIITDDVVFRPGSEDWSRYCENVDDCSFVQFMGGTLDFGGVEFGNPADPADYHPAKILKCLCELREDGIPTEASVRNCFIQNPKVSDLEIQKGCNNTVTPGNM
ncbi:MAG: hypothetical protein AAF990_02275 [Bacteroidota bacterium]